MGVNYVGTFGNITIYEDEYHEKNKILKGRKQGSDKEWLIMHPETAKILYDSFLINERINKIKILMNGYR